MNTEFEKAEHQRVMALPVNVRKELLYLAHLDPVEQKSTLLHNVAVSGERLLKTHNQHLRTVLEGLLGKKITIKGYLDHIELVLANDIEIELVKLGGGE